MNERMTDERMIILEKVGSSDIQDLVQALKAERARNTQLVYALEKAYKLAAYERWPGRFPKVWNEIEALIKEARGG